jgi:argininosuccinate lyase
VEDAGVPIEIHKLRSGRSRSSKRMTQVKMWKKQELYKNDTS